MAKMVMNRSYHYYVSTLRVIWEELTRKNVGDQRKTCRWRAAPFVSMSDSFWWFCFSSHILFAIFRAGLSQGSSWYFERTARLSNTLIVHKRQNFCDRGQYQSQSTGATNAAVHVKENQGKIYIISVLILPWFSFAGMIAFELSWV